MQNRVNINVSYHRDTRGAFFLIICLAFVGKSGLPSSMKHLDYGWNWLSSKWRRKLYNYLLYVYCDKEYDNIISIIMKICWIMYFRNIRKTSECNIFITNAIREWDPTQPSNSKCSVEWEAAHGTELTCSSELHCGLTVFHCQGNRITKC